MTEETPKTTNASKYTNLQPNIAAALAYIIAPFTGIAFFLIEKDDKFVRFHAVQSTIFGIAIYIIMTLMGITIILAALAPLVGLGAFVLGLYTMWKAYNNVEYEIPVIGKYARDFLNKTK